jgi:hypothetical protein
VRGCDTGSPSRGPLGWYSAPVNEPRPAVDGLLIEAVGAIGILVVVVSLATAIL